MAAIEWIVRPLDTAVMQEYTVWTPDTPGHAPDAWSNRMWRCYWTSECRQQDAEYINLAACFSVRRKETRNLRRGRRPT